MHWTTIQNPLSDSVHHYQFRDSNGDVLTFANVVELWSSPQTAGREFRDLTSQTLRESSFAAFKWETPVVDTDRFHREFEFVILNSPSLDRRQDPSPFAAQFDLVSPGDLTVTFSNIGKDAVLVVPTPSAKTSVNYCHLGSFVRTAEPDQTAELWRGIGLAMLKRVSDIPVWLSTAGGGVAWLHVRLDDRPKYYGHAAYRHV